MTRLPRAGLEPADQRPGRPRGVAVDARARVPRHAVQRPRLFARLDEGVRGPLTVILGPAGTGKTTLLATWLLGRDASGPEPGLPPLIRAPQPGQATWPTVWVSLSADDNDPVGFWTDVLDEIGGCDAVPPDAALATLQPTRHARPELRRQLVRAAQELTRDVVVILDDLHLVTDVDALADLTEIARRCPRLHLVAATRTRPPFASSRARLYGELTEISTSELAFTGSEVAEALRAAGVPADGAVVADVHRGSAGWAAAVRLAAHQLTPVHQDGPGPQAGAHSWPKPDWPKPDWPKPDRPRPDRPRPDWPGPDWPGPDGDFVSYVRAEVLADLAEDDVAFLLRTSVVDELTPELATELSGDPAGRRRLFDLVDRAFLLEAAPAGETFRYHQLLLNALRRELAARLPGEAPALHRRAARWFDQAGHPLAAIQHARSGEDWALLGDLLARHWVAMVFEYEGELRDHVRALPESVRRDHPELAASCVGASVVSAADPAGVNSALGGLDRARAVDSDQLPRQELLAVIGIISRERALSRNAAALAAGTAMLNRLSDLSADAGSLGTRDLTSMADLLALFRANHGLSQLIDGALLEAVASFRTANAAATEAQLRYLMVKALGDAALAYVLYGRLAKATEHANSARDLAEEHGWTHSAVGLPGQLAGALVALERADVAAARELVYAATQAPCQPAYAIPLAHALATVDLLDRQPIIGLDRLRAVEEDLGDWQPPDYIQLLLVTTRAELLVAGGRIGAAARIDPWPQPPRRHAACAASVQARIQVHRGDSAAAMATLRPCLEIADQHAPRTFLEVLVTAATAIVGGATKPPKASYYFDRALELAASTGARRPFFCIPAPALHTLVAQARASQTTGAAARAVCADLERLARTLRPRTPADALSRRERYIIGYLAHDRTLREIANHLFVSPNTLKTQLRSVYRKLGATSRSEAVELARVHGLL